MQQTLSFVVVAESLEHNFVAVYLFQTKLIAFLKAKFTTIKKIFFFSDGSAAQYKNRRNFFNVCEMKSKYGFDAEWHFFATYHGKGPCDAVGGTIKRMATRASLQRPEKDQILNAKKLFEFLQSREIAIQSVFCTKKEHDQMAAYLENKYDAVKTISGTQKLHAFIPCHGLNSMECKRFSFSKKSKTYKLLNK